MSLGVKLDHVLGHAPPGERLARVTFRGQVILFLVKSPDIYLLMLCHMSPSGPIAISSPSPSLTFPEIFLFLNNNNNTPGVSRATKIFLHTGESGVINQVGSV